MAVKGDRRTDTILVMLCFGAAIVTARCERGSVGNQISISKVKGVPNDGGQESAQRIFNVLNYGAEAEGARDSTTGFVSTFMAACNYDGDARMVIPEGNYYVGPVSFRGPCKNASPLVVECRGIVKAHTEISLYKTKEWINFEHINSLIITGTGTFDGQGQAVWKKNNCKVDQKCARFPSNLMFQQVKNVLVERISSINSKGFHIFITNSENITLHRLSISAPSDSPNTDGIHISKSSVAKIYDTVINTGDDCVSMIQGSTNITIKRVYCGAGHGISVGSLGKYKNERDVRRILVKNCTLSNTDNGLRIKTWGGSPPSEASGITFQDIIMENVHNPIIIDQNYGRTSNKPSMVKIKNVHYVDVKGTTSSKVAVKLICSAKAPCQNLRLYNISLNYVGKQQHNTPLVSSCINAKVKYMGMQKPPPCH